MPAAFLEALGIHLTPVFNSTVPLEKEKEVNTTTITIIPARSPAAPDWPDSHAQHAHRKTQTLHLNRGSSVIESILLVVISNDEELPKNGRVRLGLAFSLAVVHRSIDVN